MAFAILIMAITRLMTMTEETKGVQRERTSAASLHLPPSLSFTYLLSLSPKSSKVGDP